MIVLEKLDIDQINELILILQEDICEKILQQKTKDGKIVFSEVECGLLN